MGRAAQELLGSLNQGVELAQKTTSYVWVGGRIVRGWAIELVLIALLVPFLIAIVDLYALCRRYRIALQARAARRCAAGLPSGFSPASFSRVFVCSAPGRPARRAAEPRNRRGGRLAGGALIGFLSSSLAAGC